MNIAVFFGGRSCEHDISIITGVQVLNALGDGYRVLPVYMKDGGFYTSDNMKDVGFFENPNLKKATRIWLIDGSFYTRKGMLLLKKENARRRAYMLSRRRGRKRRVAGISGIQRRAVHVRGAYRVVGLYG